MAEDSEVVVRLERMEAESIDWALDVAMRWVDPADVFASGEWKPPGEFRRAGRSGWDKLRAALAQEEAQDA